MIEVTPGILEQDVNKIRQRIGLVDSLVSWVQIDIADGIFVSNKTLIDPVIFKELITEFSNLNFELHMMVEDPFKNINEWIGAGFKRFLIHIESKPKLRNWEITKLKEQQNVEIGLAIDRDTPIESVYPYLDFVDCVLVMTIKAGFSGQSFMPELLEKVKKIKKIKPNLPVEVDGGINDQTGKQAVEKGATRLVSTSYIYNSDNIKQAIWTLQNLKS